MKGDSEANKLILLVNEKTEEAKSPDDIIKACNTYFDKEILAWIEFKGLKILYADFSNLTHVDIPIRLVFISRIFICLKPGKKILILANLTDTKLGHPNIAVANHVKESFKHLKGKFAIYGLKPVYRIFTRLTSITAHVTDEKNDALDYLANGKLVYGENCPR